MQARMHVFIGTQCKCKASVGDQTPPSKSQEQCDESVPLVQPWAVGVFDTPLKTNSEFKSQANGEVDCTANDPPGSPSSASADLRRFRAMSAYSETALRKRFNDIDTDGGGTLDREELAQAMKGTGRTDEAIEMEIERLLGPKANDPNNEATVNFEQFKAVMQGRCVCLFCRH